MLRGGELQNKEIKSGKRSRNGGAWAKIPLMAMEIDPGWFRRLGYLRLRQPMFRVVQNSYDPRPHYTCTYLEW